MKIGRDGDTVELCQKPALQQKAKVASTCVTVVQCLGRRTHIQEDMDMIPGRFAIFHVTTLGTLSPAPMSAKRTGDNVPRVIT